MRAANQQDFFRGRTMPVRHSDRKPRQIAAVRSQCGKHARTPCKTQNRPASSQRYYQSPAIWHHTTMAVRGKPSKRCDDDPYDGKPLRYKKLTPKGYVVYSIGRNRVDDGGFP